MITAEALFCGSASELRVEGHAEYAKCGRDIVCAGVSALCGALSAHLSELEKAGKVAVKELMMQKGRFYCRLWDLGGRCGRSAVEQTCAGLTLIAEGYPEHLSLAREYR